MEMKPLVPKKIQRVIACSLFAMTCTSFLMAEDVIITIRLIDGKNGKPIKDENLNIFSNQPLVAGNLRADQNGLIRLTIDRGSTVSFMSNIQVTCHQLTNDEVSLRKPQQYKVTDILEHGISDTNTCSKKIRLEALPGEFVYYERPRTLWEWMAL